MDGTLWSLDFVVRRRIRVGRPESGPIYPAGFRLDLMFLLRGMRVCLTKDLRYDSKDSREMEKGSFSLSMLR